MGLVFAAILPHGPGVIAELTDELALMATTRAAMAEAGHRFAAAQPEVVILLDPQAVHESTGPALAEVAAGRPTCWPASGSAQIAVATAERAGGVMSGPGGRRAADWYAGDSALAAAILAGQDFPLVAEPGEDGSLPLVGGALIPLWFTLRPLPAPRPGLVVVDAGSAVPRTTLWRFGAWLAAVAAQSDRRVALLASADQGHTHDPSHERFGFSPAAAEHDRRYCEAVTDQRLDRLLDFSDELLRACWTDSLWQTLILAGAVEHAGLRGELLSYEVPSYFGMAVAAYAATPPAAPPPPPPPAR